MKAITFHQYGNTEHFKYQDVPKPVPQPNQVLVKVYTTSINSWDNELIMGIPFANRISFGLFKPKLHILGSDISGVVKQVGSRATNFKPGDKVFGDNSGFKLSNFQGFAEYICIDQRNLTIKPPKLSHIQAASLPQAGLLALQGLKTTNIKPNQKVLINGAGGGAGTFAIQIAKYYQAHVTAIDSKYILPC